MFYLEHIATFFTLIGVVLNIKKNKWCFPIWLVANSMWVYIMYQSNHFGMMVCQIVFCATCVWGWFSWRKER